MPLPFIDNAVPYGSSRVIINSVSGSPYVAENISLSFPTRLVERQDQLGAPNGFVIIKGQPTGSCTLQIATSGATYPNAGDTITAFSDLILPSYASGHPWAISNVTSPYEQAGVWKTNLNIVLALFS